jgi:hypothetical protein
MEDHLINAWMLGKLNISAQMRENPRRYADMFFIAEGVENPEAYPSTPSGYTTYFYAMLSDFATATTSPSTQRAPHASMPIVTPLLWRQVSLCRVLGH